MNPLHKTSVIVCLSLLPTILAAQQIAIPRIETMAVDSHPSITRDWKQTARDYDAIVYDTDRTGEHLPLVHIGSSGTNYADIPQFYLDTYVGTYSAGSQAEAINILPSLVGATLVGIDKSNDRGTDWVGMSRNFFNRRNGQMVYLNGYNAASGHDWWYDVMPNVYFYQLFSLYSPQAYRQWEEQFRSVASRWYEAVTLLGGDIYTWNAPSINYRAFNLATGTPLATGVAEPEAAGSIAWLLYKAYLHTGEKQYMQGAQLCLEALCSHPSNPSYELQLAYGVQVAAAMNAREGCNFYIERLLNWCFDRGPLRGWGSIVGNWGGYNASGLIGEANDRGNDYAFVMNGFQQAAALAPVAKYDKRFARSIAKWITALSQTSALFYKDALPVDLQEPNSAQWLQTYDTDACLPFESIKEHYNGHSPYAMGDAIGGGWAATNISLYSGSSVGYLAAVVDSTSVIGVTRIDVNATDFLAHKHATQYLYYNPHPSPQTITEQLPAGSYDLYDVLAGDYLTRNIEGSARIEIGANDARMIAFIPAGTTLTLQGTTLYAGDSVVDYNHGYDYNKPMMVNALAVDHTIVEPGEVVTARLHVRNIPAGASLICDWTANDVPIAGTNMAPTARWTVPAQPGIYTIAVKAYAHGQQVEEHIDVEVVSRKYDAPAITALTVSETMPVATGSSIEVTATLAAQRPDTEIEWQAGWGTTTIVDSCRVVWQLPHEEGVYTLSCTARNRFGSNTKTTSVLVRNPQETYATPIIYYPLNGNTLNEAGDNLHAQSAGGGFVADSRGTEASAFAFASHNDRLYTPANAAIDVDNAITLSCWFMAYNRPGREQFIFSHGSWEERYKLSLTPEMKLRWTVNCTGGTVDVDSYETIEPGTFYHVVALYTGFSQELYVNGAYSNFAAQQGNINHTNHALCYGAKDEDDTSYHLVGRIDEIRLYDTALSPTEACRLNEEWELSAVNSPYQKPARWYKDGTEIIVTTPHKPIVAAQLYAIDGTLLPCTLSGNAAHSTIAIGTPAHGAYLLQLTYSDGMRQVIKFIE